MKYVVGTGLLANREVLEWNVNGEVNLPILTAIGERKYLRSALSIINAKASVRVNGTSQYTIQIISYDNAGANSVTHINQDVTFSGDNTVATVTVSTAAIAADRIVELKLQQLTGNPATDLTVTLS
jgi:hypothetical protein